MTSVVIAVNAGAFGPAALAGKIADDERRAAAAAETSGRAARARARATGEGRVEADALGGFRAGVTDLRPRGAAAHQDQEQERSVHGLEHTPSTSSGVAAAAAATERPVAAAARRLHDAAPAVPPAAPVTAHSLLALEHPLYVANLLERGRAAAAASKPPASAVAATATDPAAAHAAESVRALPASAAAVSPPALPPPPAHAAKHDQALVDGSPLPALALSPPPVSAEGITAVNKKTGPIGVSRPGPRNQELEVPWLRLKSRSLPDAL